MSKSAMESLMKLKSIDPPQSLSPNPNLSLSTRVTSLQIFTYLKRHTSKSPFDQLLTDGFDSEQIWQQIDIQSQPLISSLKREINRFEKKPDKISSLFGGVEKDPEKSLSLSMEFEENEEFDEDMDVGLGFGLGLESDSEDIEENEDGVERKSEDEDGDDDEDGMPEVEDEFLKIKDLEKFLVREEKKEFGENEIKKKKKTKSGNDDDDEEVTESDEDLNNADAYELLMYGGLDDDEDGANIRYDDFYLPNKKVPKSRGKQVNELDDWEMEDEKSVVPKRRKKQVDDLVESDEPETDDEDKSQNGKNLSTHEKEREKLQAKIKQMEEANLAAKDWTMQGEVTVSKRPRDRALEVDLDFEHNMRPPPVITEEVTTSLEDMIKKRIFEGRFDDVQRAPKLPSAAPKERKELDDNKSKKGLAEIYEDEYAKQTVLAASPLSHNDELRKEGTRKLAGTVNWGTATVVGIFAGMLYGGSKEAADSVSKDAEVTLKLGSTPDKREQYRLMRDAMEKRFVRVTRGSIVGGVRLGMFTASFYGLQNWLAEKRGVHDVYNIAAAGSATAATFGLIMPGSLLWRAKNVMLGSVLGAVFCFPLGWAHLKLVEKANEERIDPHPKRSEKEEIKQGVGAAIKDLKGI